MYMSPQKKKIACSESPSLNFDRIGFSEQATAQQQRSLKNAHQRTLYLSKPSQLRAGSFDQKCEEYSKNQAAPRQSPSRTTKKSTKYDYTSSEAEETGSEADTSDDEFKPGLEDEHEESIISEDEFWGVGEQGSPRKLKQRKPEAGITPLHRPIKVVDLTSNEHSSLTTKPQGTVLDISRTESRPMSSDDDTSAILRFSPPRTKSPCKRPPSNNVLTITTPPQSPSKSKLASPQKLTRIPPTPHQQSHAEFWDAGVVNSWNDRYSPAKQVQSPRKIQLPGSSDNESVRLQSPSPQKSCRKPVSRKDSSVAQARRQFAQTKHKVAEEFFAELDSLITEGEISRLAASTGGVKFIWSNKLNSTAGRAHWRREVSRKVTPDNTSTISNASNETQPSLQYRHHASIELAEKVIDHEERLLNVIAHEYCHLANFMISGIKDQPHGVSFKRWAKLVSNAFADRNVEVTTKHTYQINYKYAWLCSNIDCAIEYTRHSRSIDPKRHTCGKCKSKLVQIRPVPRKGQNAGVGKQAGESGAQSQYQMFVKENYGVVRRELGEKSPMKDVMKEIGSRYRARKEDASLFMQQEEHPREQTVHGEVIDLTSDANDEESEKRENGDAGGGVVDTVSRILDFLTLRDTA